MSLSKRLSVVSVAGALLGASVTALADGQDATSVESVAATSNQADVHAPEQRTLNLAALLRRAEEHWPGVRAAQARIEAAEARLTEAWVSPFFQFNATGAFSMSPGARGTPLFSPDQQLPISNEWGPVLGARIEGAIPLYTFGKLEGARDAARAGIAAARADDERVRQQLRFDVRRAYFALGVALDTEQMFSEGRGKLDRALEKMQESVEANDPDVNEMDVWRLALAIAEVDGRMSEVERLHNVSQVALNTLTSEENFAIPECPLAPVQFELQSLQSYQVIAADARPELAQLSAAVAAREAVRDMSRGQYFPDLALTLGAGITYAPGITNQSNPFVQDSANTASLSWGLVARWSLDFWGTHARTQRASFELTDTLERSQEARSGISIEVANAYEELRDARRREATNANAHRIGRQWFLSAAASFQVGAVEPRDLVDAVKAYFTARFGHLQAIHDVNVATAKLEKTLGRELLPYDQWEQSCE